jgi:hypothetical protein
MGQVVEKRSQNEKERDGRRRNGFKWRKETSMQKPGRIQRKRKGIEKGAMEKGRGTGER